MNAATIFIPISRSFTFSHSSLVWAPTPIWPPKQMDGTPTESGMLESVELA